MRYRQLGKTGLTVSVVGIGTFQFGGAWGKQFAQPEVDAILQAGREIGINLIDTAECYGDHLAEKLIGKAIKADRQRWVVATKFGHRRPSLTQRLNLWSVGDVRVQLEDSLRSLQTDYIDLYQFHSGTNDVFDNDALWSMLEKQVQAGKIRSLGISVSTSNQDFQRYQTDRADSVGAGAIQVRYNRLVREAEQIILPSCRQQGLGVLARVPLESGFLTGKYQSGVKFDAADVRSKKYDADTLEKFLEKVARIRKEEVPTEVPMASWALAWCLKHPAVTCVIPGCKTPEHILQNAAAADLDMVTSDHPLSVADKLIS
jgi:myo-inositol catabolism protein IolS